MSLTITVPASKDQWDEEKQKFVSGTEETEITLEHSLMSISKWEGKFKKPFLGDGSSKYEKTPEELFEYIKCMVVPKHNGKPLDDKIFNSLTEENIKEIGDYINDPMTATTINNESAKRSNKIITSELIYCWMIQANIPSEYQKWHLNRLITLIEVCGIENNPNPKKMSNREALNKYRSLNAQRRAEAKAKRAAASANKGGV